MPTPQNGQKHLSVFDHFVGLVLNELESHSWQPVDSWQPWAILTEKRVNNEGLNLKKT